ncbi:MAG: histidinol phosphatase [Chitinophagaceae bacterium]|nr:histidinol phosphatase [Chitinophagaceae bacterium]
MFTFFKKKNALSGEVEKIFSLLQTDMHSHLLPGIDDGAKDTETSLQLIKGLHQLGYTRLITTPHVLWDLYKNTPEIIKHKLQIVREALEQNNIPVEINAAAEYFLDDHVGDLLKRKEPLLAFGKNYVLVEFSLAFPQHNIKEILFEMQMQGYQPVIAHPERYIYLKQNKPFFDELKYNGCLFQLNLLSVTGYYGKTVTELSGYLLNKKYYDLLGTDLHHVRHLEMLQESSALRQIRKIIENHNFLNNEL